MHASLVAWDALNLVAWVEEALGEWGHGWVGRAICRWQGNSFDAARCVLIDDVNLWMMTCEDVIEQAAWRCVYQCSSFGTQQKEWPKTGINGL